MSLKFGRIQPWTAELAALDQLKKSFIREYSKYLMTCCQVSDRCPLGYMFETSDIFVFYFYGILNDFHAFPKEKMPTYQPLKIFNCLWKQDIFLPKTDSVAPHAKGALINYCSCMAGLENDYKSVMSEIEEELYKIHAEARKSRNEDMDITVEQSTASGRERLAFGTVTKLDEGSPADSAVSTMTNTSF